MECPIILTESIEFICCDLLSVNSCFDSSIYFLGSCFALFLLLLSSKFLCLSLCENGLLSFLQSVDGLVDLVGYITKILHVSFSSF